MKYYNSYYDDKTTERVLKHAHYLIDHMCTIREVAKWSGSGKSTVHRDLSIRLYRINRFLYEEVQIMFDLNIEERARRGGLATQRKKKAR